MYAASGTFLYSKSMKEHSAVRLSVQRVMKHCVILGRGEEAKDTMECGKR